MFCGGALVATALTSIIRNIFGITLFSAFIISIVPTLIPVAFCAFYKKNGMTFIEITKVIIRHRVRQSPVRLYRTENFYALLADCAVAEKERRSETQNAGHANKKAKKQAAK